MVRIVLLEGMAKSGCLMMSLRSNGRCNALAGRESVLLEGVTEEARFRVVVSAVLGPAQMNETDDPRGCATATSWPRDTAQSLGSIMSCFPVLITVP